MPSEQQLAQAVHELFYENIEGMTELDYAEHSRAWLSYGFDEGPMFVADASRHKTVTLLKYADPDDVDAIAEATFNVDGETLLTLWRRLSAGEIDKIQTKFASCGW